MAGFHRLLVRRYRRAAPRLYRWGIWLLALLLLSNGIAAFWFPQTQAALSLTSPTPIRVYQGPASTPTTVSLLQMPMHGQTILAIDDFHRANRHDWGVSTGGQVWQGNADTAPNYEIANQTGVVNATS